MGNINKSIFVGFFVFLLLVLGKFSSLFRDIIFSMYFGSSKFADAYFAANIIPGLLNMTFVMSALVFFIPVYNQCLSEDGEKEASYFTSNLMTVFFIFNFLLSVFAFFVAPLMMKIIGPGFDTETYNISIKLARILVWSFPVTVIVHVLINVSNANQKHLNPQLITLFNSIISIILMYIYIPKYGIYAVPVIGIFGWTIQIFIQKRFVQSYYRYKFVFNLKDKKIKKILKLAIPAIVATATVQINLAVDNIWGSTLGTGNVSMLNYAQKIFNLINGTFTTALITISYPILSKFYARKEYSPFISSMKKYFRLIVFIMLPIVILSIVCREEIVKIIYFRGAFDSQSIKIVSNIFMIYSLVVVFAGIKEFSTRTFYIMNDSRTPTIISIISVLLNIVFNFVLVKVLGVYGIATSTLLATIISNFIGIIYLQKRFKLSLNINVKINNARDRYQIIFSILILTIIGLGLNKININNDFIKLLMITITTLMSYFLLLRVFKNDIILYLQNIIYSKVKAKLNKRM